jgi:HSP20 family protein
MTIYFTPTNRLRRRIMEQAPRRGDLTYPRENELIVPVDVRVEGDDYIINAILPGVKSEDLNVEVMNESVTIQGEIKDEAHEGDSYLLRERPTGRFYRMLSFPTPLDTNKADAQFENGILTLKIPKAETARARTIKVKTQ